MAQETETRGTGAQGAGVLRHHGLNLARDPRTGEPEGGPQQTQPWPGGDDKLTPQADHGEHSYKGGGKLEGLVALVTGGDSGIGRAVAVLFAREGAAVSVVYLEEDRDAAETQRLVEAEGGTVALFRGDIAEREFCRAVVEKTVEAFGAIDVLVNNAAEQHLEQSLEEITPEQWERTFRTNIHAYFYLTRAALPHLGSGSSIVNTTSVNAYKGNPSLIAYSSTKGAIVSFTRSISTSLIGRGIRVNGVAPGPVWTPLIPATFPAEHVESFGTKTPLGRAGQPNEVASCFLFLACADSSYVTGQFLHPNGGDAIAS